MAGVAKKEVGGVRSWGGREGSAAVANAFRAGTETITPVRAETIADSIAADRPADGVRAVRAATQTGEGEKALVNATPVLHSRSREGVL